MKEELQGKLVEILASIQTAAGKASDFAMEQLPDIAQQYVAYGRAMAVIWAILIVAMFGFVLYALRRGLLLEKTANSRYEAAVEALEKKRRENQYSGIFYHSVYRSEFEGSAWLGASGGVAIAGVLIFMLGMSNAFLVWFAPKVWLLKEIASLIR